MSTQLDALLAAQNQTNANVAALQSAVATLQGQPPATEDLSGAISAEQANAAAIAAVTAQVTGLLTPATGAMNAGGDTGGTATATSPAAAN